MNKKKIIVIIGVLIVFSCILCIAKYLFNIWKSDSILYEIVRMAFIMTWIHFAYNMITLKYKWIRKLAE